MILFGFQNENVGYLWIYLIFWIVYISKFSIQNRSVGYVLFENAEILIIGIPMCVTFRFYGFRKFACVKKFQILFTSQSYA